MDNDKKVWVLWWRYYDKPGARLVRLYGDEERGIYDYELVKNMASDRVFYLDEISVFKEGE
jgi:hypothetical protein